MLSHHRTQLDFIWLLSLIHLSAVWCATCLAGISADDVRSINRAALELIQTASVDYTCQASRGDIQPSELPQLNDQAVKYVNANRSRIEHWLLTYDLKGQRYRADRTDLRDLRAVLAEQGLPDKWLPHMSRTSLVLGGPDGIGEYDVLRGLRIYPARAHSAPSQDSWLLSTPLRSGCLPDRLFELALDVSAFEVVENQALLIRLVIARETGRALIDMDPQAGYRYVRFELQDSTGRTLEQSLAGDYRQVDGIFYPFHHEYWRWNRIGQLVESETIDVHHACFNIALAEEDVSIALPAGTKVSDVIARHRYRLRTPRSLSGYGLRQFGRAVIEEMLQNPTQEDSTSPAKAAEVPAPPQTTLPPDNGGERELQPSELDRIGGAARSVVDTVSVEQSLGSNGEQPASFVQALNSSVELPAASAPATMQSWHFREPITGREGVSDPPVLIGDTREDVTEISDWDPLDSKATRRALSVAETSDSPLQTWNGAPRMMSTFQYLATWGACAVLLIVSIFVSYHLLFRRRKPLKSA